MTKKQNKMDQIESYKVLFADDDQIVHILGKASLEDSGFELFSVDDGAHVLSKFEECRPDIVILDINLPGQDGISICSDIRKLEFGKSIPILMITGLNSIDVVNKCFEAGATDFETKPINWLVLGQKLRFLMKANEIYRQLVQQGLIQDQQNQETDFFLGDVEEIQSFDTKVIENIRMLEQETGKTILDNLLRQYLEEIPPFITLMEQAIESKNAESLCSCSFYIKSKSDNIGATKMSWLCKEFEAHLKYKKNDSLPEILGDLRSEYQSIQEGIENKTFPFLRD